MYKLFLTFRYLTRKKIVVFPILVVWLCVMMLIIVTSIMGGFVERVRSANRDLFGDIIISSGSATRGFANYDELAEMLKKQFPQIGVATPTVQLYGLIYVPSAGQTRPMQLVGIKPEERMKVSKFRESLYLGYKAPMQAVEDLAPELPGSKEKLVDAARKKAAEADKKEQDALKAKYDLSFKLMKDEAEGLSTAPRPDFRWLYGLGVVLVVVAALVIRARLQRSGWGIFTAVVTGVVLTGIVFLGFFWPMIFPRDYSLAEDAHKRAMLDSNNALATLRLAETLPDREYKSREDLAAVLTPPVPSFKVPPEAAEVRQDRILQTISEPKEVAPDGVIVGSQIGFFERDMRGNFLHPVTPRYQAVTITVFPSSQKTGNVNVSKENAVSHNFTIVDDSHTGVYDVDSYNVYAPFELVQEMAGMRITEEDKKAGVAEFPPLCHELLIKLSQPTGASEMRRLRAQIELFVEKYQEDRANQRIREPLLKVETWDEKQAKYLGAVENEKVMMTFILGLMSMVVLVVIFLIFYQIVRDKTRDIGIIKAVGGSEEGVAGIFLTYGLFIGLVGGGLGLLTGTLFVTHTNEIHEWIYRMTGIVIWDRSVYLFDRIPDVVNPWDCVTYFTVAIVAGLLGALIPAIVAGAEDPVQAVRYE